MTILTLHPALHVDLVTFRYKRASATLRDFSWTFPAGRTLLLGPNGSGKSTLLRVIAGLLKPSSGRVAYSSDTNAQMTKLPARQIGYLPQESPRVRGLSVQQQVEYSAWLAGLNLNLSKTSIEAIDRVHLLDKLRTPTTSLSGGEARRLNLACAIVHSPDVLLLDEPTTGLDPVERINLAEIIGNRMGAENIITATHEAEALMDVSTDIAILVGGKITDSFPATNSTSEWLDRYRSALSRENHS